MRLDNVPEDDLRAELERRKASYDPMPDAVGNPDFSKLRKTVIDGLELEAQEKFEDEDLSAYIYEAAVEAIYGTGYWQWRRRQRWSG